MTARRTAAIVLAAGHGTRMKSTKPKVMHPIAGQPMVLRVLATLERAGIDKICVVVGPGMDDLVNTVAPHKTVVQLNRLGTAHAALCAKEVFLGYFDDILVLNGDNPLIPENEITALLDARQDNSDPAVVVLGFNAADPGPYGRMVCDTDGALARIVEAKDANPEELTITLCSSGMMALDGRIAFDMLAKIDNKNAAGEYYLPDVISVAQSMERTCTAIEGNEADLQGINSRTELAQAEAYVQSQFRLSAMAGGATLVAPETVFFSFDTLVGQDVLIEPNVVFGPGVQIADNVTIKSFCHLEGASVASGAIIGPFARLRPGTDLGENVKIGNFVEVKNANFGIGAKANHLSYVGDSDVGQNANIGAGTITCNYDGVFKWRTTIGEGAFIGSNSALVAPVNIGDGAIVGAGSTIAKDVSGDALAVTRAPQREIKDWGRQTFEKKKALKAKGEKG